MKGTNNKLLISSLIILILVVIYYILVDRHNENITKEMFCVEQPQLDGLNEEEYIKFLLKYKIIC